MSLGEDLTLEDSRLERGSTQLLVYPYPMFGFSGDAMYSFLMTCGLNSFSSESKILF